MERGIKCSLLLVLALTIAHEAVAQDRLKIAVGGRGIGETFVTEVGDNAGLFRKHNLAPDFDKQTGRVIVANADELKARPDVFVRYMRGYRESLAWIYSTPEGLKAYAAFAKLSEETARRALKEFLPLSAGDPDRISGVDA